MIKIHAESITIVDVKKLKPRPYNRKSHPAAQIEKLVDLYKLQGFRNPIIVSNQSGQVVCGTGRLLAAKKAGLKEIPVIYQDYDSPELEYAHHVADNALPLWGEIDLSGINRDIIDLGPELNIECLALKGFVVEPAEKERVEFEVSKNKKETFCPECGCIFNEKFTK